MLVSQCFAFADIRFDLRNLDQAIYLSITNNRTDSVICVTFSPRQAADIVVGLIDLLKPMGELANRQTPSGSSTVTVHGSPQSPDSSNKEVA